MEISERHVQGEQERVELVGTEGDLAQFPTGDLPAGRTVLAHADSDLGLGETASDV